MKYIVLLLVDRLDLLLSIWSFFLNVIIMRPIHNNRRITLTVERCLAVVSAVAVERAAAAGCRRSVRIRRTVISQTVVTVRRTASLGMAHAGTDSHTSVSVMKVLSRFIQRETLHPQIELLMAPRAVRRCERRDRKRNNTTSTRQRERLMNPIRENEGHTTEMDDSITRHVRYSMPSNMYINNTKAGYSNGSRERIDRNGKALGN